MTYLALKWTSKASAHQRSGRAGRTMEGTCVRLWLGDVFYFILFFHLFLFLFSYFFLKLKLFKDMICLYEFLFLVFFLLLRSQCSKNGFLEGFLLVVG